jgi:endonuclease YncB( thermonuclease family)|tara:strand:+ start:402 stop:749 length:348 start_codon:yes stop_codon:yes gene_type:complete
MYRYNAKLDRVVDGDTIDALVDLGFDIWKKVRIRMVGMNAPESRTKDLEEKKLGLAAKNRLKEILNSNNDIFTLQSQGVGKYGRCLGEIFIEENISINQTLINEGYATEYYGGAR